MNITASVTGLKLTRPACVTIGNFDGVHLGHQELINLAQNRAAASKLDFVTITFWPHPRDVLKGAGAHHPLTSRKRRLQLLQDAGALQIVELPFTPQLAAMSANAFVRSFLLPLNLKELVIGYDFSLGCKRQGTPELLMELGRKYGFIVNKVAQYQPGNTPVSSTLIRQFIAESKVADAARLLGRFHTVCGEVVHGFGRGSGFGFPTANLSNPDALLPGNGVYACFAQCDGKCYQAAVNIGFNPTFDNKTLSIEAFLLDTDEDLYGSRLCLQFVELLRHERKFASQAELAAQIETDIARARVILARANAA